MSQYEWLRLIVWTLGVPIILALCVSIVRRTRAINDEFKRIREEEDKPRVRNPYADMAALMENRDKR